MRDKIAWFLASMALYLGTKTYRNTIKGLIELGMATADHPEAYKLADPEGYYRAEKMARGR